MNFHPRFIYNYSDQNAEGVFSHFRAESTKIHISSLDYYTNKDDHYCGLDIKPSSASALVDGNESTAWRNLDVNNAAFIIDFFFSSFYLTDYLLYSPCNTLYPWYIKGSNDKHKWNLIDEQNSDLNKTNQNLHYKVKDPGLYRYFKFESKDPGLIHLLKIEFFGSLIPLINETCQKGKYSFLQNSILLYIFIFFSYK